MPPYNFLNRFLKIAAINIATNVTVPLAGAISVAFLGHLSNINYLSGVALGAIAFNLLYEGCAFIKSGTTAITAQAVGQNDRDAILLAGLQNSLVALTLGIIFLVLLHPLRDTIFGLLNTTLDIKLAAADYFKGRIWGCPAVLANLALTGWLLGREQNTKVLALTAIGNVVNILLSYLFIVVLNWASLGAGMSLAISQYIILFLGLGLISHDVSLKETAALAGKVLNLSTLQSLFTLNRDLAVRSIAIVCIFSLVSACGALLGTDILAENALILQMVAISMYMCDGVEYATATLAGNFKGQESSHKFMPLLQVALATNLIISLIIGVVTVLFPYSIFHLFTNHTELIDAIKTYIPWILMVAVGSGFSYALDGYFAGLGEGKSVRKTYFISGTIGVILLYLSSVYFQSNHFLWFGLSMFMLSSTLVLGIQVPATLRSGSKEEAIVSS